MYGYYCIEQDYFRMKEVAEKLNIKGFGQNNLFKFLREKGILEFNNQPKEEYVKSAILNQLIQFQSIKILFFQVAPVE